ncbi:hypothetical protein MMC29_006270, partial [Sticta canariensis]|nr:hypothetical protein [Sticta canariensis]
RDRTGPYFARLPNTTDRLRKRPDELSMASPTELFDLNKYEKGLDRERQRQKWKRGQQALINIIEEKLAGILQSPSSYGELILCRVMLAIIRARKIRSKKIRRSHQTKPVVQTLISLPQNVVCMQNLESPARTWVTTGTDNPIYISTQQYQETDPAQPEEPEPRRQLTSVTSTQRTRSAPRIMFRWLRQKRIKMVKVLLNSWWRGKKLIFWSTLIPLFLWFVFHFREPLFLNTCRLHGLSQLSFCISSAAPLPPVKLNLTETLVSANENLSGVVEHLAVMHAFPELLFGMQWTMTNLSADMRVVSHYPETRRNLLLEFREYRSASSAVYVAIKILYSSIYDDVRVVLTFTDDIVEQLQQLRNSTWGLHNPYFADFIRRLGRHPARPMIGIRIPLKFEAHLDRLLPKLQENINACERVIVDFKELQRRLDNIQAIATNDRHRRKAEHVPTDSSRIMRLRLWTGSLIKKNTARPEEAAPGPDEKLLHFRPIIVQGSQSFEYILSRYRAVRADLERLARRMRQHADWARGLHPVPLAHDLRLGRKGLAQATKEWVQLLVDDHLFLRLNPAARQELNPLAGKIEAEAGKKKRVGEERDGAGRGGEDRGA